MNWQLQEAKNKFSQVVREAQEYGPQIITVHGKEAAVVLSAEEYAKLIQARKGTFLKFMQSSPWAEIDLDIERSKDTGRDIEL